MSNILTYGTFDLLHHGHIQLLKRARALGGHLTVAVSSDEFNRLKGKFCTFPDYERIAILEAIRYVDRVIVESSWEQKINDVQQYKIDKFIMGDDWKGHFDFLSEYCEVIYLPRTEGISTTKIKKSLSTQEGLLMDDAMGEKV